MSRNDDIIIKNLEGRLFRVTRVEWSGGDPIYVGKHRKPDAATSDLFWEILKITWTSGEPVLVQQNRGAWDDRATLF